VPADFGVRPSGTADTVVYSEVIGEAVNPIDRATIEAQCRAARQLGLTDRHPVFEPGHDHPLRTESRRFTGAGRWAVYDTLHSYGCDPAPARTPSPEALCACTYRSHAVRHVQIRKAAGGRIETLWIDLAQRTAHRSIIADRSVDDPDAPARRLRTLAPAVVGRDRVAGIACVLRRQRLSADGWIDRCIADDEAARLHPALRDRALSETTYADGGRRIEAWSKATTLIEDASVDSGVFELPDAVALRDVLQ
jgi:hypothetical protein